jgi:LytS/YehU family sensor histidine kinase
MAAWRNPSGAAARGAYWFIPAAAGAALGALATAEMIDRRNLLALMQMVALGVLGLWFTIVYRHQYIESRLREAAEREKAVEMARRLAAAQVEPHFLFNTLASVQHWVQTKDDRAAPLLAALTGYLRATLPLFNRPLLAAGDELVAVQRYLEVMQARMGTRLSWRLDVEPAAQRALLPPGVLLTLVENAIVHGLEPRLAGGEIVLRGRRYGADVHFEVRDNGLGAPPDLHEGVGLANIRQRLQLACGDAARVDIGNASGGGCSATIHLPFKERAA